MIDLETIREARERIRESISLTPLRPSRWFSEACGCDVHLKLDNLQYTGSFKERGAVNKISQLSEEECARGLICASAGNHAQALAYHAGQRGIPTVVVMPKRAPLLKISNTRSFGAEVRLVGDTLDEAVEYARELEREHGYTFVHPFEDPQIIAGQGTVALEMLEQRGDLDVVVVPIGGGGLISGIGSVYKALRPEVRIVGVESAAFPSMKRSLEEGKRVKLAPASTIADGIAVKQPGELTLGLVRELVDDIVTVDEEEIANAILLLLEREKTVVEGAAATTLAALYNRRIAVEAGQRVGLLLCGGNIDVNLLSRIIERGLAKDGRIVRLDVTVRDRPGNLARLLNLIADAEANVLEVHHERNFEEVALGDVHIELTLETRGTEHLRDLARAVREAGFEVERL